MNKTKLFNFSLMLGAVILLLLLGSAYLFASSWLISGIFNTTFTVWQSLKVAVLVGGSYLLWKLIKSTKVEP